MKNYNNIKYKKAKKKVKEIKDFYTHLTVYIIVNTVLLFVHIGIFQNGLSHLEIPKWSMFTTPFFWGIGLFFHGVHVFKDNIPFLKDWEERKISEYMEKEDEELKQSRRY